MHVSEVFRWPVGVVFWVVFFAVFAHESRIVVPAMANASSEQDRGTFRTLAIGSPIMLIAAIAASFLPAWTIPRPLAAMMAGMGLMLCGAVLRRLCFNALGASFTGKVVVRVGQPVVQHGVYRLIRHPSYSAAMLMYLGVGVALGSWISVGILFVAHCVLYGLRVSAEERALVATLGEPYRAYMARTKRFIPFVV